MIERPVNLDMGSAGAASSGTHADSQPKPREQADSQAADQFRARMAAPDAQAAQQAVPLANPFSLFNTARTPDAADSQATETRTHLIEEAVSRMLVSDTSRGGESEVRLRLANDLLPGTEVRVSERGGALQVEFVANAESGAWLAAQAESIAGELARRLRREVRVAVRADDAQASSLAEETAQQDESLPAGPAALFGPPAK